MVGLNSINTVKIYPPTYANTVYSSLTFNPSGKAKSIHFYQGSHDKYIMGSDNGGSYAENSTSSHIGTSGIVRVALVDPTNDFLIYGK